MPTDRQRSSIEEVFGFNPSISSVRKTGGIMARNAPQHAEHQGNVIPRREVVDR